MDTTTGWGRNTPHGPSGRWRTILSRARGGGRGQSARPDDEPTAPNVDQPAPSQPVVPAQTAAPGQPGAGFAPGYGDPGLGQPVGYQASGFWAPEQPTPYPGGPAPGGHGPRGGPGVGPGLAPPVQPAAPAMIEWRSAPSAGTNEHLIGGLRRPLPASTVLAFANPKGGVHKTTATVLAAATIGSVRGRGVVAWDDNELRGTLGLRAGSARHARTIRHLVTELAEVEARSGPDLSDRLDDFLRHASDGSYDVLAGEEDPRFARRLDPHTVRRLLELLRRTHDVICVDTGNNVESGNWQTVLQASDQLVVTTVPRDDSAFSADWMLDLLEESGMSELVANAVTLLSLPTPRPSPMAEDIARHFAARTRAVAVVPYDPVLEAGASIEFGLLRPETRQAWLAAASVIMAPFGR